MLPGSELFVFGGQCAVGFGQDLGQRPTDAGAHGGGQGAFDQGG